MTTMLSIRSSLAAALILVPACSQATQTEKPIKPEGSTAQVVQISLSDIPGCHTQTVSDREFAQCSTCHSLEPEEHSAGPSLHKIIGKQVGSNPGVAFSPTLSKSNLVWTIEELDLFLKDPQAHSPGNYMPYAGMKNDDSRNALLCFLAINQ